MVLSRECPGLRDGATAMIELLRILRPSPPIETESPNNLPVNSILFESADPSSRHGGKSILIPDPLFMIRGKENAFEAVELQPKRSAPWKPLLREAWKNLSLEESPDGSFFSGKIPALTDFNSLEFDETERLKHHPCLAPLELLMASSNLAKKVAIAPTVGLYGMISYDLVSRFEELPPPNSDPWNEWDFQFWLSDHLITIDHLKNTAWITVSAPHEEFSSEAVGNQVSLFNQLSQDLNSLEQTWKIAVEAGKKFENKPTLEPERLNTNSTGLQTFHPRKIVEELSNHGMTICDELPAPSYEALVSDLKEKIKDGVVFQIVPSRANTIFPIKIPWKIYFELRKLNPSPYMFFIRDDRGCLLGASPETFLRIERVKSSNSDSKSWNVITCPIAGTRPRGLTPDGKVDEERDLRYEFELKSDVKELAEHSMLIDLARNDIAKVSIPGSRRVEKPAIVEKFSHVQHLVSWVKGELNFSEYGPFQAYLAVANAGTLTGAPKISAMKLLRECEVSARGYYGGSVGYFGFDGTCDLAIVIRSLRVIDELGVARSGAGIVADSIPPAEFDETERKLDSIRVALLLALKKNAQE
ncbi:chorismate-binding protein [bacterium]|nr:chorismate-binding protein [bacterium]